MNTRSTRSHTRSALAAGLALLLLNIAAPAPAAAQDGLAEARPQLLSEAKALYAAASYEDALTALGRLDGALTLDPEAHQYRALCLLALGRAQDAERAMEAMVAAAPGFVPSSDELSPKLLSLFADVRRKMLPGITRKLFAEAREHYHAKAHDRALKKFEQVLALASDPILKDSAELNDLRTLAAGFVDLAKAGAPAAPAAANGANGGTAGAPSNEEPAPVVSPNVGSKPPVAIRQVLPEWVPPDAVAAANEFSGAIKVVIGVDGRVKSASMVRPTHPLYDAMLLQAARNWVYRPATKQEQPVEAEKIIEIQLRKRD
jgi:tetratricopeptide (TPR) repeat protein